MLIFGAVGFVVAFFANGMLAPGRQTSRKSSAEPSVQSPPTVGDQKPGMPTVLVPEHETWPRGPVENSDRQLDVKAPNPSVQLPVALGGDLAPYWQQSLNWQPCGNALCATMKVPLGQDNPGKATLDTKVAKTPFENPTKGLLFVNPDDPGIEGGTFAVDLESDKWKGYGIIAWDPHDPGESTYVRYDTTGRTDRTYFVDDTPDGEAKKTALNGAWAAFIRECRETSGELLDHISTIENVRDLGLLCFLTGTEKLNYLNVNYGTFIGAMYAGLFPERTGHLMLDSAMDIADEGGVSQAEGLELALELYADWCAGEGSCSLGNSRDEVISRINSFLHGLDPKPLKVGDRQAMQGQGADGTALFLYSGEEAYPGLTQLLDSTMNGDGRVISKASDLLSDRTENGQETVIYALPVVWCVDRPGAGVATTEEARKKVVEKAPVFDGDMGSELICEHWTANSAPNLKLTDRGAASVLAVGATEGSATPYQQAVTMAKQLESGHLLTCDDPGHGSVTSGNACVDGTVTAYFEDGTLPEDGKAYR